MVVLEVGGADEAITRPSTYAIHPRHTEYRVVDSIKEAQHNYMPGSTADIILDRRRLDFWASSNRRYCSAFRLTEKPKQ